MMSRSISEPSRPPEEFRDPGTSRVAEADGAQETLRPKDPTDLKPSDEVEPYPVYPPHMFGW